MRLATLLYFVLTLIPLSGLAFAAEPASGVSADSTRYGFLDLLDHRSRYGQYWFPEPFRVDETDVDNELRLDWIHQEGKGHVSDNVKAEVEKSFGLLTVELEVPYSRDTITMRDPMTGRSSHDRAEGIGNVSIGARHPIWQYVSSDDFWDNTIVAGFEVGIPTNSIVSKNSELVPKILDDLRLGEHASVQTVLGYSFLLGSNPDGGTRTFEYAAVFGYSFEQQELPIPGIERLIPILELKGEMGLNKGRAGHDNLSGTVGVRLNLKSIGPLQPRLGIGYVFPIDEGARGDFRWGVVTSLVFEF